MISKIQAATIISLVYTILFNIPIAWFDFNNGALIFDLVMQINLILLVTTIIFTLLLLTGKIGKLLIILLFVTGGIISYFVVIFGKNIAPGVIHDILSVECELSMEYLSIVLFLTMLVSMVIGTAVCQVTLTLRQPILLVMLLISLIAGFVKFSLPHKDIQVVIFKYSPISLFASCYYFFTDYLFHINDSKNKIDLTEQYEFHYSNQSNLPLVVIFIIGESMRGDLISLNGYYLNNMPLLKSRTNLISFTKARSAVTSTKEALPRMLTRIKDDNSTSHTQEKGIISIFKRLGFKTAWIGSQGLFGSLESTYASNALEAETVIVNKDIKWQVGKNEIYDSDLLPFIEKELNQNPANDKFIVVHLLGSHWHFNSRYPENFPGIKTPICVNSLPTGCTNEQIKNSYFNSILFTDFVLDSILKKLKDKNAVVIYSSDHGMSLGENGIIGNAAVGENIPNEQLDIAMFIWMSDQYLATNPKLLQKVQAWQYRPVSHANLFHSLLGCAGISSDVVNQSLNICP